MNQCCFCAGTHNHGESKQTKEKEKESKKRGRPLKDSPETKRQKKDVTDPCKTRRHHFVFLLSTPLVLLRR